MTNGAVVSEVLRHDADRGIWSTAVDAVTGRYL